MSTITNQLQVFVNSEGYVILRKGNHLAKLHRIIAEKLYGNIPPGWHVHHKDGNKLNNKASNLEVIDHKTHVQRHRDMRANAKRNIEP